MFAFSTGQRKHTQDNRKQTDKFVHISAPTQSCDKSIRFLGNTLTGSPGSTVIDRFGSASGDSVLQQHVLIESPGTLLRRIGFNMTVDENHIISVVMLHPEMPATGLISFDRTESRMIAHSGAAA